LPTAWDLLEDLPENELWPPVPPDVDINAIQVERPEISVRMNSMLYRTKGHPSNVFKMRGEFQESNSKRRLGIARFLPVEEC
jgi:hypothetical protein